MDDSAFLDVTPTVRVPRSELTYRATRSGGPGGQHVNTSSTRIELWWDVARSNALSPAERSQVMRRLATRLDPDGNLRLVASSSRSQLRNKAEATERLRQLLAKALHVPKPRRRTRVPTGAKQARLTEKKRRGEVKRQRGAPRREE